MFMLTLVNTADVVTLTSFVCFCCSLYSADICLCVIIIMLLMTQWRKSGSKAGGTPGRGPKGGTLGQSLEARIGLRGGGVLGEGDMPPPHQLGIMGSAVTSPSRVRGQALAT